MRFFGTQSCAISLCDVSGIELLALDMVSSSAIDVVRSLCGAYHLFIESLAYNSCMNPRLKRATVVFCYGVRGHEWAAKAATETLFHLIFMDFFLFWHRFLRDKELISRRVWRANRV